MAIDKEKKSNRLLASRRYTHDTFTDAQESFTNVLDYKHLRYILKLIRSHRLIYHLVVVHNKVRFIQMVQIIYYDIIIDIN